MSKPEMSRRAFVKAASAVAVPAVVPSSVFGAGAPSEKVTLAAIGTGSRGSGNCRGAFLSQKDVRIVAAVDPFTARRERFAAMCNKKYGKKVCEPFNAFEKVLARKDIDGVVVSTPDHWHVPIACHAAVAGKDLYVEKPLGVAMAWAIKLREAVEQNKVIFQYGTQQRSSTACYRGVVLVRGGYVGKIKRIDIWSPSLGDNGYGRFKKAAVPDGFDYDRWLGPAPLKPYTPDRVTNNGAWHIYDYALGFIAGWGAHPLDIMQWGMDADGTSPVRYKGTGTFPPENTLSDTLCRWDVQLEYPNGVPVRFMSEDIAKAVVTTYNPRWRSNGTTFFGEDGWISISRGACYVSKGGKMVNYAQLWKEVGEKEKASVCRSTHHGRNFIDSIRSRKPTVNPFESAIRGDTISHLSDIAVHTGREIRWDPEKEQIIGDSEAAGMLDRPLRKPWTM